jgi:hypothetical protein
MAAHLAQHAMAGALAAGATTKNATNAGHAASVAAMGEKGSATIRECAERNNKATMRTNQQRSGPPQAVSIGPSEDGG